MAQLSLDQRMLVGESIAISYQNKQNIEQIKQTLGYQVAFSEQLYYQFDAVDTRMQKLLQLVRASDMQLAYLREASNLDVHAAQSLQVHAFSLYQWNETLRQIEEKVVNLESSVQAAYAASLGDIQVKVRTQLDRNLQELQKLRLYLKSE